MKSYNATSFITRSIKTAKKAEAKKLAAEKARKAELAAYQAAVAGKKLSIGEIIRF